MSATTQQWQARREGSLRERLAWSFLQRTASGRPPEGPDRPGPAADVPAASAAEGRLRILVIEDNEDYADSLQVLFELQGHEAFVAYTGPDGVESARQHLPNLVVCDIGLPGIDGFQVAKLLREDPATAAVCLIAVTGYGSEADRRLSAEAGFDAHLVKPVEAAEILRLARQVLAPATEA